VPPISIGALRPAPRGGTVRCRATMILNLAILSHFGRMGFPGPVDDQITARLRVLSQFAMSESEAAEGARNLVSFFRLLAKVDSNETERGNDHAE
jgi:hypothetical protein